MNINIYHLKTACSLALHSLISRATIALFWRSNLHVVIPTRSSSDTWPNSGISSNCYLLKLHSSLKTMKNINCTIVILEVPSHQFPFWANETLYTVVSVSSGKIFYLHNKRRYVYLFVCCRWPAERLEQQQQRGSRCHLVNANKTPYRGPQGPRVEITPSGGRVLRASVTYKWTDCCLTVGMGSLLWMFEWTL